MGQAGAVEASEGAAQWAELWARGRRGKGAVARVVGGIRGEGEWGGDRGEWG